MKKILYLLIVLIIIGAGYYGFLYFRAQKAQALTTAWQTVRAEQGELTATVGATGTVRAKQTVFLSWQTSGVVAAVNVILGDKVFADKVLASLEQTSLPQNVILAEVDLINAKDALDELLEPATELEMRQAEQAIAIAQQDVRDAERYLNNLLSGALQVDIDQARANLVLAENKLKRAREDFEPYAKKPEDNLIRASLQSRLAQAQKEYDNAVRKLNNLLGKVDAVDLAVAEANLALAQSRLVEAQDDYSDLQATPDPDQVQAAEARIAAAQANLNLVRIAAQFAATITEVQIKPGDLVSPGTVAFRLDDLSELQVDVQVSEVDVNLVDLGQTVVLTFDAIQGKEYHGVVQQVAQVGNVQQGVVEFTVTVKLNDADEDVKPGMTAAVNIVVNQLLDVLVIPNRAVRMVDGQRVVYVLRGNVPVPVEITLGASSETVSEVLAGDLKAGDQIVLNPPTSLEQEGHPPFIQR